MELLIRCTAKTIPQRVSKTHYWYDSTTKQMLTGVGGELKFRYDGNNTVPYLSDVVVDIRGNNFNDILDWVKRENLPVLNMAKDHYVLVDVEQNRIDEYCDRLTQLGILYDY